MSAPTRKKPAAAPTAAEKARARRLLAGLRRAYPDADCTLDFQDPLQLLVATVLSAQCTDERVNKVTPALFRRYPTAAAFAEADPAELEDLVRSTGFFRQKAKSIRATAGEIVSRFGGKVPRSLEELVTLRGIGRKTANVILGNCFGQAAIVVDTHVKRLSHRLGLTTSQDPDQIELDLRPWFPESSWTKLSHMLIQHGRRVCHARKPRCSECSLAKDCPSRDSF